MTFIVSLNKKPMDYLKINKKSWNERVDHHINGAIYEQNPLCVFNFRKKR